MSDPLDLEAVALWEEENGVPWDPDAEDHDNAPLTAASAPRAPRASSKDHPHCRLRRKVRHHYAESADGLLRVCLGCAGGLPLAQLTAAEAAAELIAQRRPLKQSSRLGRVCLRAACTHQLQVATLLSGIIGLERERGERAAGLRTHALVGLGSCLMMIVSAFGSKIGTTHLVRSIPRVWSRRWSAASVSWTPA